MAEHTDGPSREERVNAILSGHEALAIREYEHRVALWNYQQSRWHRTGAWLTSRVPGFWRLSKGGGRGWPLSEEVSESTASSSP